TYGDTKLLTGWTKLTQFNAIAWTIAAEQFRSIAPVGFNEAHTMTQLMAWDPVKVQNQGFELKFFADPTLPARWSRGGGSATQIRLTTAEKYSGAMSAEVISATGDGVWQMLYQDWKQWKPSTTYRVTFNVKTSGVAGAKIFMYNTTTSSVVGTAQTYDSAAWSTQSFTFTTPAAGPSLRLYLENHDLSTAGTAYFDNVVIKIDGEAW
ncbi:carbohydrate binding domain-containing protein, partial [Daejeonella sp.]|uniref:carbohydrate binding domain-containing protein n=1 Tax=Daejeonella sp. TaxID=2805397 RepID=UPI0030C0291F